MTELQRSGDFAHPGLRHGLGAVHRFHIPVMGTGFSIDTPLRVAPWGIASVISLVDDGLIERIRKYHEERLGLDHTPISAREPDARARRITAYLDLVADQVEAEVERIRQSPFEPGSAIDRYFALLPAGPLADAHAELGGIEDAAERQRAEQALRAAVVPGSIDVNIMTKIDRRSGPRGEERPSEDSDALSALRGFANSKARGAIVFSAGLNARLYAYAATLDAFAPDENGELQKRIVLKVSDFRSATVQGRYLAKRGLWVSEYRIESGLNCGGHAFATQGLLMGPILQQFRDEREDLGTRLFADYQKALAEAGRVVPGHAPELRVTVQGGLGTAGEAALVHELYDVDATGWGTPFLLVPEVTRVDDQTRQRLLRAKPQHVRLGPSSPLGVPFWSLTTSGSEDARRSRIDVGRPGSPCPKGYLVRETGEEGVPKCLASRSYQREQVDAEAASPDVLAKACICHDLGGGALIELGIDSKATPAICPGPNIVNFQRLSTFEEMVDHIYGRKPLELRSGRPHVFVAELKLYLDELAQRIRELGPEPAARALKDVERFHANLVAAIDYYRGLADRLPEAEQGSFVNGLDRAAVTLADLDPASERRASA